MKPVNSRDPSFSQVRKYNGAQFQVQVEETTDVIKQGN